MFLKPDSDIPIIWGSAPQRMAFFLDHEGRRCSLADSSVDGRFAIRFGTVAEGQSMMHLRIDELNPILEPLRRFVRDGTPPDTIPFRDWNDRQCIMSPSSRNEGQIDLGVVFVRGGDWTEPSFEPLTDSIMLLTRQHVATLLLYINSFVAHGSIRPEIVERCFGIQN
jgi:hypothetical protein